MVGPGRAVTLLALDDGLLPRMEPFARELVAHAFIKAGIDMRIDAAVTRYAG
jgi:pyruvate/2-oxoglutarate dehydrogenase complex dihydrolipoamide dehydrogenase (E3) component